MACARAGSRSRREHRARPRPRASNTEPVNRQTLRVRRAPTAGDAETVGGLSKEELSALGGTDVALDDGPLIRFADAVRRTIAHELEVNPKVLVFGEDVGVKGGVHLVTEGLQRRFGPRRVFDTSLSEEGIVGRAVGMAVSGLMPVAEIQFRKYADPATEQLNNCGTVRWRTNNQFAAPIVVRMPGGFGKDVGDPWHSLSSEVTWAHAHRLAGARAVERGRRGRAAARGDAESEPEHLLRAPVAAHDQ